MNDGLKSILAVIYEKYMHCLENKKGYYYSIILRNSDKGECLCYSSSQDD